MRWWCTAVVAAILEGMLPARASGVEPAPVAPATILIDAASGQSLGEQDAAALRPVGSLSHLMVLLLSLEEARFGALRLDVPVTVSPTGAGALLPAVERIPLHAGKAYLLSDLLKAMLISSAGDATLAVAEAIGGSTHTCLELMNARAHKLGMHATNYASIGGVAAGAVTTGAEADQTSARDQARLAQTLVRHRTVLEWASLTGIPFDNGATLLRNTNQLIGKIAGIDGLFSGSGGHGRTRTYSSVATARQGGLRLIAVVLGAPDSASRYSKAADLLIWGFEHFERLEVVRKGQPLNLSIPIRDGTVAQLTPVAGETYSLLRRRGEERNLQVRYQVPAVLKAPINRNDSIGEIIIEEADQVLAVVPIRSPVAVSAGRLLSAGLP